MRYLRVFLRIYILIVVIHLGISLFRIITTLAPDFSVFYQSAFNLTHGINPYKASGLYTGLGYPLATLFLYIPFLLFPYQLAQGIFVVLSAISAVLIVYLSLRLVYPKFSKELFLLLITLAFLSFPTKFTLGMGQSSLIATLLLISGFSFYTKKAKTTSGILTGLAILSKPILGFMLLFYLLKKERKIVITALMFLLSAFIFSVILFGFDAYLFYITSVIPQLLKPVGREIYYNQGFLGFVSRLTNNLTIRSLSQFIFSLFLVFFTGKNFFKKTREIQFALLLTILTLIDTLSWQHHFVFLIFPFITAGIYLRKKKKIWVLVASYLLISGNIRNPETYSSFPLNLFLSHTFYGAMILFLLLKEDYL